MEQIPEGNDAVALNVSILRLALRVLGWSQAELARRIDVSEATVSRAMGGRLTTAAVAGRIMKAIPGLEALEVIQIPDLSPSLTDRPAPALVAAERA